MSFSLCESFRKFLRFLYVLLFSRKKPWYVSQRHFKVIEIQVLAPSANSVICIVKSSSSLIKNSGGEKLSLALGNTSNSTMTSSLVVWRQKEGGLYDGGAVVSRNPLNSLLLTGSPNSLPLYFFTPWLILLTDSPYSSDAQMKWYWLLSSSPPPPNLSIIKKQREKRHV